MTKEIREQIHQKLYYGSNLNNPRPYEDSQEKILDYLEWYYRVMFSYSTIDEIDGVTRIVTPTNGSPLLDARKELIDIHGINLTDVLYWEEKMISLARENQ